MKKQRISNEQIARFNQSKPEVFPKYTTQIINLASSNAQGTRPEVVGQMSELFPEYVAESEEPTIDGWREWYEAKHPFAYDKATERIIGQIENLKSAIAQIDEAMVRRWVEDLVVNKTFNGMWYQKAILDAIGEQKGVKVRYATPEEESKGVDGYIGGEPVSIKPDTYEAKAALPEDIPVRMITYKADKSGIVLTYEDW